MVLDIASSHPDISCLYLLLCNQANTPSLPQIPPAPNSCLWRVYCPAMDPIAFGIMYQLSRKRRRERPRQLTLFIASVSFGLGAFVSTRPWVILGRRFAIRGRVIRLIGQNEGSSTPRRCGSTQTNCYYNAEKRPHILGWLLRCTFEHKKRGLIGQ